MAAATTTLTAPDIVCGGCANSIKRSLGNLPGVSAVDVDVETKRVTVTHDEAAAPREAVVGALDNAGFPATVEEAPVAEGATGPTEGCSCCRS